MAFRQISSGPVDRGAFERFQASIDAEWIEEALHSTGTATVRRRRLPAEQVLWLVVGMALFRNLSIEEVVRELGLALPDKRGTSSVVPSAAARARARLGFEPLCWLFTRTGSEWAHRSAEELSWRGLKLYGVDGSTVRVPDSDENRAHFGPVTRGARGLSGYPLLRLVTLMALRSHELVDARFGPYDVGETPLAKELWALVPEDSLVLVDRGFFSAATLIPLARDGKRHWVTRAKKNFRWKVVEKLGPGDAWVEMKISDHAHKLDPSLPAGAPWRMRAIRYQRKGFRTQTLLTSLLDPKAYPAKEGVALYHERWELELGFDEVKTHMLEREEAIRSRTVRGVEQEVWGLLLAYNLVRHEMRAVARAARVPPSRISFIASLRMIRLTLLGFVFTSPGVIPERLRRLREDLTHFILPERRTARRYPRAVKIKMSNFARKRRASVPAPSQNAK